MGWDAQHSAAQLGMLRGVNAIILLMMGIFVLARVARPLNSWRGGLVLAFAVAGVAGMFIPPVARFFALVIPSGEMLAATGVALVESACGACRKWSPFSHVSRRHASAEVTWLYRWQRIIGCWKAVSTSHKSSEVACLCATTSSTP